MEALHVHLPSDLAERLRQEIASDEALDQIVAEAVHMWLEQRRLEKVKKNQSLSVLRQAGLVMDGVRQRALANAMMPPLRAEDVPSREQVEAALAHLKVPLSEDIVAMRGERS